MTNLVGKIVVDRTMNVLGFLHSESRLEVLIKSATTVVVRNGDIVNPKDLRAATELDFDKFGLANFSGYVSRGEIAQIP